jgi:hypothetical protein
MFPENVFLELFSTRISLHSKFHFRVGNLPSLMVTYGYFGRVQIPLVVVGAIHKNEPHYLTDLTLLPEPVYSTVSQ